MNLFAQAQLNLVEAWNMSWEEGIQFIIVLVALYYAKKENGFALRKEASKDHYIQSQNRRRLRKIDLSVTKNPEKNSGYFFVYRFFTFRCRRY